MIDAHYTDPRLARLYDLDSPWSIDRQFYLDLAGTYPRRVLDVGCGTGLICAALSERGHDVTGVDPSPAMLEVARTRPVGDKVRWIEARAQKFVADARFDLIFMTGHAFQVLLEDRDVQAALRSMGSHLADSGVIAFETRNPDLDWPSEWNYEIELESRDGLLRETRRFLSLEKYRMKFEIRYEFPQEVLVSRSELRFWTQDEVQRHLQDAGLQVQRLLGDWHSNEFCRDSSEEMIFIAGHGSDRQR